MSVQGMHDYRFNVYENIFRKNFLHEKEIGIIPPGGYRRKDNQSRKALQ